MCDIRCGSYRPKRVDLGYSAPYWRTYVIFCVWGTCRGLNQPSKLHHPPLHDLVFLCFFCTVCKMVSIAPLVELTSHLCGLFFLFSSHLLFIWIKWDLFLPQNRRKPFLFSNRTEFLLFVRQKREELAGLCCSSISLWTEVLRETPGNAKWIQIQQKVMICKQYIVLTPCVCGGSADAVGLNLCCFV